MSDTIAIDQSNSAEAYHSLPGVSNSRLNDFIEDPRLYHHKYLSGRYVPVQKADHFDFGSAVHEVVLLGDNSNIVVIPRDVLSASGSRAGGKWKGFLAENSGKILLKQADCDRVMRCVDVVQNDPVAKELFGKGGIPEKCFAAEFTELGFALRCRPDFLTADNRFVVDLKTTGCTKAKEFAGSIAKFGYARQEYFYRKVLAEHNIDLQAFVFIAVSVEEPHTVDSYTLSEDWIAMAADQVEEALSDLARRTIENDWDSATKGKIVCLSPPNWVKYENQYSI